MKVIIVNGFLGSGKTTFLKRFLQENEHYRTAVVVNEFSDTAFDDEEIKTITSNIATIKGGSIFCTCKTHEFVKTMFQLCKETYDYILVETSGFSNPSSLSRTLNYVKEQSSIPFETLTLSIADPVLFPKLMRTMVLIQNQIRASDVILLNKTDLANEEMISETISMIRGLSEAPILRTEYCSIPSWQDFLGMNEVSEKPDYLNYRDITLHSEVIQLPESVHFNRMHSFLSEIVPLILRLKGSYHHETGAEQVQVASGKLYFCTIEKPHNRLVILYSSKVNQICEIRRCIDDFLNEVN